MSNLEFFFAENVEKVELVEKVVSNRFKDADGNPIKWHFGAIDGTLDSKNRADCTKKVAVPGKPNLRTPEVNVNLYLLKNAVDTIKFPNLKDARLQDSYGVMSAEELLQKMLLPAELQNVLKITTEVNGFNTNENDLVEEAKN